MPHKKATLRDIAERLNITVATVSRALSDHPDISKRVKDQVKLVAEALHYRPNTFALHLRRQRSGIIGVMLPRIVHYYSSTMISGILSAAHAANYQVLICESGSSYDDEKKNAWSLLGAGVDGLLVSLSNHPGSEELFASVQQEGIPIVFFDKVPTTFSACKISTNDFTGAFLATEHLLQQGYKKIAHLKGQKNSSNTLPRLQGYEAALKKFGLKTSPRLIKECTYCTEEEGYEVTLQLMKAANKPDAIFCVNDETAIGALAALRTMGIDVPSQVGVAGFSNAIMGRFSYPTLTSVDQFGESMGWQAMDNLLSLIRSNAENQAANAFQQMIIEPKLLIRESTSRLKSK